MENISATTEFTPNYTEILTVSYTKFGNVTDTKNSTKTSDVTVARLDDTMTIIASLWITIAVISFLGNVLMFIMTHNQSIRDQSYALFLCVPSVVDSIVLFVRLIHGSALLSSTQVKPQGPLVGILDTNLSCVLTGLELSARCLSAWILGKIIFFADKVRSTRESKVFAHVCDSVFMGSSGQPLPGDPPPWPGKSDIHFTPPSFPGQVGMGPPKPGS